MLFLRIIICNSKGHNLNLFAIKTPYYISASFKYACSKLVCMNMLGLKNALNRYIFITYLVNPKILGGEGHGPHTNEAPGLE